ncbi:MAG: hypothetical protein RJA19_1657 [Bacteroidota bacterium]
MGRNLAYMGNDRLYAIVDIETTGGRAEQAGITEVAVVLTDGRRETGRWSSLIRPDHPVPQYITALTGITTEMVAQAPPFEAVAAELMALLQDRVFVAHNVGFDYGFLQCAFERAGLSFSRPRLCTVRLARQVYRGGSGYGLTALCQRMGIPNDARHRAMGDCAATAELFHRMLAEPGTVEVVERMLARGSRESWLPSHVPVSDFEALPEGPGVYRFLDRQGAPLYIGMSHAVRTRVRSHFQGAAGSDRQQMLRREVHGLEAEATGSVLYARLWEDVLIRRHWPAMNRAQKLQPTFCCVVRYRNRQGLDVLALRKSRSPSGSLRAFPNETEARNWLFQLADATGIAPAHLGLGGNPAAQGGAERPPEEHNALLEATLAPLLAPFTRQSLTVMSGPVAGSWGVAMAAGGALRALGFWEHPAPPAGTSWDDLLERLPAVSPSWTADAILASILCDPAEGEATTWYFAAEGWTLGPQFATPPIAPSRSV